jgi:hypothetical protein
MTSTYLPQGYPLFVARDLVALPGNIGAFDVYDAKAAVARALDDQLNIERVVAWLIEDPLADDLEPSAKPITVTGLGVPFTVAEARKRSARL